jgi:hypothetical protein
MTAVPRIPSAPSPGLRAFRPEGPYVALRSADTVYFKRHFPDSTRASRLRANDLVTHHIANETDAMRPSAN